MANTGNFKDTWQRICQVAKKVLHVTGQVFCAVGHFFKMIVTYIVRMRKIIMAVPVVIAAVKLAQYCSETLPKEVGLSLQENGEYALMVSRDLAVFGPLLLTTVCLLLMFCSRRTLYPWLISIFTLALPLLIIVTNMFPA